MIKTNQLLAFTSTLMMIIGLASPASAGLKKVCHSQRECERACSNLFSTQKTIRMTVTKGTVLVKADSKSFKAIQQSKLKFKFVEFLKLTVNGTGIIERYFPNGEFGGRISFDGVGVIEWGDDGRIDVLGRLKDGQDPHGLKVSVQGVTMINLADDVDATVSNSHFVYAFRNSSLRASNCQTVQAYSDSTVIVDHCKSVEAHDNAKINKLD